MVTGFIVRTKRLELVVPEAPSGDVLVRASSSSLVTESKGGAKGGNWVGAGLSEVRFGLVALL
jgi:hypothetical protein